MFQIREPKARRRMQIGMIGKPLPSDIYRHPWNVYSTNSVAILRVLTVIVRPGVHSRISRRYLECPAHLMTLTPLMCPCEMSMCICDHLCVLDCSRCDAVRILGATLLALWARRGACTERSCQETSNRDLVQRLGKGNTDFAPRSLSESLRREFALRSLTYIFREGLS